MKRVLIIGFTILSITSFLSSQDIKEIKWGTEEWKGFTDKDGTGLYTQVLKKIYNESAGLDLQIQYAPFSRVLSLTKVGQMDIAGGLPKNSEMVRGCLQTEIPIVVSRFNAFYKKDNVNKIDGIDSIKGKKIVTTLTVGEMIGLKGDEYSVVKTREQAIKLVINNRYDIYIDDERVLLTTIEKHIDLFNPDDFNNKTIAIEGWYLIFTNSARGEKIMNIFENGMRTLNETGELKKIYSDLGFISPIIGN